MTPEGRPAPCRPCASSADAGRGPRIGLWLIGAKGGVAATTLVGLRALQLDDPACFDPGDPRDSAGPVGLISAAEPFARLALPRWSDFVAGGHDIRAVPLVEEAARLVSDSRTVSPDLFERCRPWLADVERRLRPGTVLNAGAVIEAMADGDVPRDESPREAIDRLRADLEAFARTERLEHVIVVNVASTEPPLADRWPPSWEALRKQLESRRDCGLPASTLGAIAAAESGCSYINFTPSLGPALPAVDELFRLRGSRYYGCDGKTGETLLKSVLAPMLAARRLRVMSWVGHNIFGNRDAEVLADPANKQAKIASKDHLIRDILGYAPQTHVSIERVDSLGDWKTAWDHVHFRGFLGVPMVMQFIWQGCDSILAAPLVLDLARFCEAARRRGHVGTMPFLACFFKSPYGVSEQRFDRQVQWLERWAAEGADTSGAAGDPAAVGR
mgnify:CR=1 FL=1